jgi:pimeloyl-ACP methyl ester carboxylesterase
MVTPTDIEVDGRPARVWVGGDGEALVLLHGGWGGARPHWSTVWDRLAEAGRVVAPELPGLGDEGPGLGSLSAYAAWVRRVLDRVGVATAWLVGNSFGAALAWRLASGDVGRCRGLVLVNGGPPPGMPGAVRRLAATGPARRLLTAVFRRNAISPATHERGFADPRLVPDELVPVFHQRHPRQLDVVVGVVLADDPPGPRPQVPTLLLWGADDRLAGSTAKAADKLRRSLPGAELVVIPGAGHLPQVERPDDFVAAVARFVAAPSS